MGKFIAGVIFAVVVIAVGLWIYLRYGYVNLAADAPMPRIEKFYVRGMVDAWAERNAPKVNNPVQATEANLADGARLYKENCAVCHGSPEMPVAGLGRGLSPQAPQFLDHSPAHMDERVIFHITKHGVSRSGMPAWGELLNDQQIWTLTAFMKSMEKLPPAVEAEWKKPSQAMPGSAEAGAQKKPAGTESPEVKKQSGHDDHDHEH
ncbi:MAG TPA: cytochrome c [Terriglobales bacterium]|nr:cytochrome c [Terriglobales bacterium]